MDWREVRARLVAQERASNSSTPLTSDSNSYVYETPLIEQGTILLGGTKMDFGFALRQQFFHKSVMLLLQHDDTFTKGIILNRPSALEVDGWRVWCGHGQVAEGGMFVGDDKKMGDLEINALHSLTGFLADKMSIPVIKGVSYMTLEGARALVKAGVAEKSDFWICVGYSGWAPGQLQMEVEKRDSWYLASADSGTLLKELLREARELPPPGDSAISIDQCCGIDTWSNLMRGIGREADALQSKGTLEDRMLEQWVRVHLLPKKPSQLPPAAMLPPKIELGTVLSTMVSPESSLPADRVLIHEQFLHKALLLVLSAQEDGPDGKLSACILNRPTANRMRFNLPGSPQHRIPFCGNLALSNQVWLHHRPELGGVALGDSGVRILSSVEVVKKLKTDEATAHDFFYVSSVVQFTQSEVAGMLEAQEMSRITPGEELYGLWPRVWSLMKDDGDKKNLNDGTGVWWLASQFGKGEQLAGAVVSDIADEALAEWLKFFASG